MFSCRYHVAERAQDEAKTVAYATVSAGLILLQQIGAKAARDALFLSSFPARDLPKVMAAAAFVSLAVVLLSARAMARLGPARLVPITLVLNAVLFASEAAAAGVSATGTALALYLHVAALGSVMLSGFWGLVTERFDPHRARRYMGRIGVGATLGGALGGLLADGVTRLVSARGLLVCLAITSAVAAVAVLRVGRPSRAPASAQEDATKSPLEILRATPYLRLLGALAGLGALWAALLDYALKSEVSSTFHDARDLMRFFAWFYTATGVFTFLVQALLRERLLKRYGIGVTVGLLPAFVAVFALLAGVMNLFATLVVLRTVESVLSNSLHRASYELFFTPLPRATKRPTKTIVDVAATRVGDALGSALVLVGLAIVPGLTARVPILVAATAAFAAFTLVPRLHRGYVDALTGALRHGNVKLEGEDESLDALTRKTLAESTEAIDREKLLQEIEAFRREQRAAEFGKSRSFKTATLGAAGSTSQSLSLEARFAATLDPVASTALILASRDAERITRALEKPIEPELAPFVVPLLANKALAKIAEGSLAEVGPRITGMLTDALLDPRGARSARCRVARLLGGIDSVRAREGLFEGLAADPSVLRLECAKAIAKQARAFPDLAPSRERIFAAATAALERPKSALDVQGSIPPASGANEPPSELDQALGRLELRVQAALALLSATLDPEGVELSARALASSDAVLRGTALEYLENVLEEPARSALVAIVSGRAQRAPARRSERELLAELQRSKG